MKNKVIVWCLFDSGGGSYQQAINKYFKNTLESFSIGMDIEKNHSNFIHLDLGSIGELFDDHSMWLELDKLPLPHIILASPPCEAWSMASAIKGGGNNCWRSVGASSAIRTKAELDAINATGTPYKRIYWKTKYRRLNAEATAFNTLRIIERYAPKVWVIENPRTSQLWNYYEHVCSFKGFKNVAHYHAYDIENFSKKPTIFYSNRQLSLKTSKEKPKLFFKKCEAGLAGGRDISRSYNVRSRIPLKLIKDMLEQILKKENQSFKNSS